ncbi:MAG TPA: zinc-ribbon domain-containing protein [Pyrinomonadaceae bacterium]|jgi:predicted Zn finger-like uncharacterized protein|nr:zinc-ribbon domain-containing protein [Pyrinomonadaceae bacterium]
MIVTCPNCTTRLQLDKAKIPARQFSVRCPKCQQIISAQPPSASPQRDALAAVEGLPASNRVQQEVNTAHVTPVLQEDGAAKASQPAPAAGEAEVLRLLASLLRGEGVEGAGSKGAGRRPAWERRRVLVCAGSAYAEEIVHTLAGDGYEVFAAANVAQAMGRMREGGVDVVALDPEFNLAGQGAATISREMASLRMTERRRVVFVMLSEQARTGDAHAAFLAGVNLVVNLSEVAALPRVLEKNVRDLNELYRDFNKALKLSEL